MKTILIQIMIKVGSNLLINLLRHGADLNLAKGRHGVLSEADRSNIEHQVLTVGSNSKLVDMNKRKASGL